MKTRLLTLAILLCGSLAYGDQLTINLGTAPSGTGGDNNRQAFTKVNTNFTELYTDVADLESDLAGLQPLDSDLTAIAALTTATYGRSLLTLADASAGRTSLGLVIGTDVQAFDADLSTYAGITPSANVQSLLAAANYAAIRTALGLVIGTDVQAYDADLTTFAAITPSANVQSLLGAASYAAMRTLLDLEAGTDFNAFDTELGQIAALADPNADRILFWDDSAGAYTHLTLGSNLSITGTTINATGGGSGSGSVTTIKNNDAQVGGADIVTLDFSSEFGVAEAPDTEVQITIGSAIARDAEVAAAYQPLDSDLTLFGAITPSANVQSLLGAANYAAMRTLLDLEAGTDFNAYDADLATWAGVTPGTGVATFLATPSSANLAAALTTKTGTGNAVFSDSPTFTGTTAFDTMTVTTLNTTTLTATTPAAGDNDTSVATTAFVNTATRAGQLGSHTTPDTTAGAITWTAIMYVVYSNTTTEYDLPAAAGYAGRSLLIYVTGTNAVTIDPNGSEVIVRDGNVQTGGVTITLTGAAGNYVGLYCDGVRWVTLGYKGTLAVGS